MFMTNLHSKIYDKVVEGDGDYLPKVETKNALAIYLGHKDWYHFATFRPDEIDAPIIEVQEPERAFVEENLIAPAAKQEILSNKQNPNLYLYLLIIAGGLLIIYLLLPKLGISPFGKAERYAKLVKVNKVDRSKIPFAQEYLVDYNGFNPDSLFVEFYDSKPGSVTSNSNKFSVRYLTPGIYGVVLKNGIQIVDKEIITIPSNGWQRFIVAEPNAFLYPENKSIEEVMSISNAELKTIVMRLKHGFRSHYDNVGNLNFDASSFTLTTRLKSTPLLNDMDCYSSKVKILGDSGSFVLCFTKPGCGRLVYSVVGDVVLNGNTEPQDNMAVDLTNWRNIKLIVENKQATVTMDSSLILKIPFNKNIGKVLGVQFRFEGDGKVDYVKIKENQGIFDYYHKF
jgi:hypothetical protein